jgi:hypothetical protein
VNKGGMSSDGKRLIDIVPTGNIQITEEMMQAEQVIIDDAFLVTLFQLALKTADQPNFNARQVLEFIEQKAQIMAPTIGPQMNDYVGPMIPRELDVLAYEGLLPEKPQVVREAEHEYDIVWTNPMTRMMRAGRGAGFMQVVEMFTQIAQASGDSSVFDHLNLEEAAPELADDRDVPSNWIATPQQLKKKAATRAQQAEREARAKEMPALAAMKKADAIQAKAQTGGNIGGTLSGVAPGGMPQIPGNAGMPGQPGIGGRPGMSGRR